MRTSRPGPPVVSAPAALEFLTRAGMVLAGSLNYEQTLAHVVDLVVPEIADWCGVYLPDAGDGEEREITSRHADAELEAMIVDIRRRRRDGGGGSESLRVLRTVRAATRRRRRDGGGGSESLRVRRTGESILVTDVSGRSDSDLDERHRAAVE